MLISYLYTIFTGQFLLNILTSLKGKIKGRVTSRRRYYPVCRPIPIRFHDRILFGMKRGSKVQLAEEWTNLLQLYFEPFNQIFQEGN